MSGVNLTRWQRANLAKLAAYLWTLPADYPDFEMSRFIRPRNFDCVPAYAHVAVCGTAACAAGHGPRAGIKPRKNETWYSYSYRAFIDGGNDGGDAWYWVFSAGWTDYDNTVHGAAARIEYMLEVGLPDKWFGTPARRFKKLYADRIAARAKVSA